MNTYFINQSLLFLFVFHCVYPSVSVAVPAGVIVSWNYAVDIWKRSKTHPHPQGRALKFSTVEM